MVSVNASAVIVVATAVAMYTLKHQFGLSTLIEKSHKSSIIYLCNFPLFAVYFLNCSNEGVQIFLVVFFFAFSQVFNGNALSDEQKIVIF